MLSIQTCYNGDWTKIADFYHRDILDSVIIDAALGISADPWIPHDLVAIVREETGEIIWDNDESYQAEPFFKDPDDEEMACTDCTHCRDAGACPANFD